MHGRHLFAKLGLFALLGVQLAPAQTVPENPALGRLLHAAMFALGPVGYAGQTSPEERDYRQILARPNALASFEELFARGISRRRATPWPACGSSPQPGSGSCTQLSRIRTPRSIPCMGA